MDLNPIGLETLLPLFNTWHPSIPFVNWVGTPFQNLTYACRGAGQWPWEISQVKPGPRLLSVLKPLGFKFPLTKCQLLVFTLVF